MKYTVLLCCLLAIAAGCSDKPQQAPAPQPGQDSQSLLSEAFKKWFQGLSTTSEAGKVSLAAVKVTSDKSWLAPLGLEGQANSVMVNTSNESFSFGGGGLNGALCVYVRSQESQKAWKNLVKPDQPAGAGQYAISDARFGKIYHAIGPRARTTNSLQEAQDTVKTLYDNMLCRAHQDMVERIVLPAIATDIFAGQGTGFTKAQFIAAMYEGMYLGIQQFLGQYPNHAMRILLNNWQPAL